MDRSEPLLILGGTVLTPAGPLVDGAVRIRDGRLADVGPRNEVRPRGEQILEVEGGLVGPGLIDIHVHGGGGVDLLRADLDGLRELTRHWVKLGTTGLLATFATAPHDRLCAAIHTVADYVRAQTDTGARVLGVHLEGPYLSRDKRGAQDPNALRLPSLAELDELTAIAPGLIRLVSIAPELPGALDAIRWLRSRNVAVAIGHTNASYDQARAGFRAGASHAIHAFNGMRGLHHREPGAIGAALTEDVTTELICDGHHVHPAVAGLVVALKGPERTVLVTDAMYAQGQPDGPYTRADGRPVSVAHGVCRLEDGTLAGSLLSLDAAVRNLVAWTGISATHAIHMASRNPARVIGLSEELGSIAPGARADLVIWNQELVPILAIVGGNVVHRAADLGREPVSTAL